MYQRPVFHTIKSRIGEPRRFIQVVMGPRQVGKSTVVKQVLDSIDVPFQFFSADNMPATDRAWISNCWDTARSVLASSGKETIVLVIDEIQKISNWSEVVKKEWDSDTFNDRNIKVLLLGSSRVMLRKGLSESLMGRFEEIRMTHWSFEEMHDCFGLTLDQYMFFGGYPGVGPLIIDEERYRSYILSAIVEATINKDILLDAPIGKPALLKETFELGSAYSGQILSFTKMIGQLQDAGNTTTLAGYLNLLNEACMLEGLQKFSIDMARRRSSIPKFQVYDNSLKNIYISKSLDAARLDSGLWGRIVESAVGAYLVSQSFVHRFEVFYWRERDAEVDFVLRKRGVLIAIEVKSNSAKNTAGLDIFRRMFNPSKAFIVGDGGMSLKDFFSLDINKIFT